MPRKKGNKEFLIAGYRRIAMEKNPNPTQLRALDRLAVLTGYLDIKIKDPDKGRPDDVVERPSTENEVDEVVERTLQYMRNGGDHAATNSQSPSGQPDVRSD